MNNEDLMELKRLAANTYEQEKSEQIFRIIRYINNLESQVRTLKNEINKLKSTQSTD